jgi:hypothetical protein
MFGSLGLPELMVVFVIGAIWALPIAAAVWAGMTLHRIRTTQQAIGIRLESIERILQARH